jgi:O-antigen/teichoic acid export membrane protein
VTANIAGRDAVSNRQHGGGQNTADGRQGAVLGRVREAVSEGLVRNSAFLSTNLVISTVAGLGTLTLLTHLYSARAIGLSAAALSATSLITTISQLGLNYSLVRYLPTSRHRADLINSAITATTLVALVSGMVFLLLPTADKLYAIGGIAFAYAFLAATALSAGNGQIANVFVADRAVGKTVVPNIISSLARLAAPAALVFLGLAGAYVAQGIVPVLVDTAILLVILARSGHKFRFRLSAEATRELRRFSVGTYIAGLIGGAPLIVLPLVILARFGATPNAYWYTAMTGASVLFAVPGSVAQALLAEASHQPGRRRALVRKAAIMIIGVMLPVLTIAYLAAPFGLALLGHHYATNALAMLRLLIIAAAMSSINYITGTILYLAKKTFVIAAINAVDAVVVLGLAISWAHGAREVALAWVIGEVFNVVLFGLFAAIAVYQVHGRWEALGGDQDTASGLTYATTESQQAGMDMLMRLSSQSLAGPIYPPRDLSPRQRRLRRQADDDHP